MEKSKLFEILNDWNYWDKPIPEFVDRKEYQKKLDRYSKTGEIIVLKGIRRSGKSTLFINHINSLVKSGVNKNQILFVNFEDPRYNDGLNTKLLEQIFEVYKEFVNNNTKPYVFFDEVQNVLGWEKWVLTLYELKKAYFYITGSSSKLLSREFGTSLSGRHLSIIVFPLNFKEFISFKNIPTPNKTNTISQKIKYKKAFSTYNNDGGFPKISLIEDEMKRPELIMYYETIILKDIVARHKLKNYDNVKKVALYLLSNIGKPLNLNKVRVSLNLSYALIDKYFEYLKDTFLLFEVNQFDYSLKKQFANRKKIYCIDNGILSHITFKFSEDYGRYLENVVLVELLRRNLDVYFHMGKKECDFVIKEGTEITQLIQVTRSLQDKHTEKRELEGILEAMKSYDLSEGLILTEDEEKTLTVSSCKIFVLPVWKWLLDL
jgi:predicted AAA+ superfamily ATPase